MATEMKRLTVSLTPEIENALNDLKKNQFYNKTNAEMLRHLILLGLKNADNEGEENTERNTA